MYPLLKLFLILKINHGLKGLTWVYLSGIVDIGRNFKKLNGDIKTRQEIQGLHWQGGTLPLVKSKDPHDIFLSINGAREVEVRSNKPKAVELVKWLAKKGVQKIQEEHQQAIEEKDNALALLNDDLQEKQLQQRYVNHCINPGKNNIIIIIRNHTKEVDDKYNNLHYYIARIQRRKRYLKLRWFERHFPNHEIIVELDNPNSIHALNRFEEEEHVERKYNHFRLFDLTRDELYDMGISTSEDFEKSARKSIYLL